MTELPGEVPDEVAPDEGIEHLVSGLQEGRADFIVPREDLPQPAPTLVRQGWAEARGGRPDEVLQAAGSGRDNGLVPRRLQAFGRHSRHAT